MSSIRRRSVITTVTLLCAGVIAPLATASPAAAVPVQSTFYTPIVPCRIIDTRFGGGGKFAVRVDEFIGQQDGMEGGCDVPSYAVAAEVSISAVAPKTGGYFRIWPQGDEPNATIVNFSAGQATTNTGTITLNESGLPDVLVKNYGGPAHYVIDVQGYFIDNQISD